MMKLSQSVRARSQKSDDEDDGRMRVRDVQRFTREEHERRATAGWWFEVGWFRRDSGLEWAWFGREVKEDETSWK